MHHPVAESGKRLKSVVQGCLNYRAVPGNLDRLGAFRERVTWLWRRTLAQPETPAPSGSHAPPGGTVDSPTERARSVSRASLRRRVFEIRAVRANERMDGSVRGISGS